MSEAAAKKEMFPIADIDAATRAFPARVEHLMPKYADIPKEFHYGNNKWNRLVSDWFFSGLSELNVTPKEGVDEKKALIHISAIMRSFEPKHEHKEAACAFLLSQWFSDANWKVKGGK